MIVSYKHNEKGKTEMDRKNFRKLVVGSYGIVSAGFFLTRVLRYIIAWISSGFDRFPAFSDLWLELLFSLGVGLFLTAIIFLPLYFKLK